MKDLRADSSGLIVNIGLAIMLGMVLIVLALIGSYMHGHSGWWADTFHLLYDYSIVLFTIGVVLIVARVNPDLRIILGAGVIAAVAWYLLVMM